MCIEILSTYKDCSCKYSRHKPCSGFLKLAPDDGFEVGRRCFAEGCRKREGKREVRDGACAEAGCLGRRGTEAGEALLTTERRWESEDGTRSLGRADWEV